MRNPLLPRTGMHHNLAAAWFALDCLIAAALIRLAPRRKT